jgi:hypothetical protein
VSVSIVRLGQDRLGSVLASGAIRGSERHPISHVIASQEQIGNKVELEVSQKILVSFPVLSKMQALTSLKSHKTEVFERPLRAYQAGGESDILGRTLNGLKRKILK